MKITYLELKGYKRFALNNVSELKFMPNAKHQLILGTNGSGKSSLLSELNPWLSDKNDFVKGGSKVLNFTHRGSEYTTTYGVTGAGKYSFVKDGNELNQGGTSVVQKDLLKQEIGLVQDTYLLLTDGEHFHSMSPSRRREWFTKLSDVSYDYALRVYNKVKEELRDTQGALKLNKIALVEETAKCLSNEELERLHTEVTEETEALEKLQKIRRPCPIPPETLLNRIQTKQSEFIDATNTYMSKHSLVKKKYFGESVETVSAKITELELELAKTEGAMVIVSAEVEKANEQHKFLTETHTTDSTVVKEEIASMDVTLTELAKTTKLGEYVDYRAAHREIEYVCEELLGIFSQMHSGEEMGYTKSSYETKNDRLEALSQLIPELQRKITKDENTLEHMLKHKQEGEISCPKCSHKWFTGFNERLFKITEGTVANNKQLLEKKTKEVEELTAWVNGYRKFASEYKTVITTLKSAPSLSGLLDQALTDKILYKAPKVLSNRLAVRFQERSKYLTMFRITQERAEKLNLLQQLEKLSITVLGDAIENLDRAMRSLEDVTDTLNRQRHTLRNYQQYVAAATQLNVARERAELLDDEVNESQLKFMDALEAKCIMLQIEDMQESLAIKVKAVNDAERRKGVVAKLEETVAGQELDIGAYKRLADALSPTNGLIADGLLGFIRMFVARVNAVIKQVWSYPLAVIPCGVTSDSTTELDYKFPIIVGDRNNVKTDVSKGSSGILEIVDLAFKIVSMEHMGLSDWPLYLDEFGKSFDDRHRANAVYAIKNILETTNFSQLFMVSHYEESYGAFINAEICVLSESNIVVPDGNVNQHVSILN